MREISQILLFVPNKQINGTAQLTRVSFELFRSSRFPDYSDVYYAPKILELLSE